MCIVFNFPTSELENRFTIYFFVEKGIKGIAFQTLYFMLYRPAGGKWSIQDAFFFASLIHLELNGETKTSKCFNASARC